MSQADSGPTGLAAVRVDAAQFLLAVWHRAPGFLVHLCIVHRIAGLSGDTHGTSYNASFLKLVQTYLPASGNVPVKSHLLTVPFKRSICILIRQQLDGLCAEGAYNRLRLLFSSFLT